MLCQSSFSLLNLNSFKMAMSTGFLIAPCTTTSHINEALKLRTSKNHHCSQLISLKSSLCFSLYSSLYCSSGFTHLPYHHCLSSYGVDCGRIHSIRQYVMACASSSSRSTPCVSTRLYVSGLSFRTTHESLRNAFQKFGQLVEVNLVMDKIAKRPRGFAFLRYETEEESKSAIEGMHGKFLDGRVIFVEVAKPRSDISRKRQNLRGSLR